MRAIVVAVALGVGCGGGASVPDASLETFDASPPAECNDGLDNDGDGEIDLDDPGCELLTDDDEVDPLPECNDGVDNDGNGRIDFPLDAACDGPSDTTEDGDPAVTECTDGLDNDGNGLMDYPADISFCYSAADDHECCQPGACGPFIVVEDLADGGQVSDTIGEGPNELVSTCIASAGAERVYLVTVDGPGLGMFATTEHPDTTLDTVVYVREICTAASTELGCDDDNPESANPTTSSVVVSEVLEGESYYVIVDAKHADVGGDFTLTVSFHGAPGTACDPAADAPCLPGYACTGDPPTCAAL